MKLVAGLALLATYAFFYEYLPPLKRVHIYSDIENFHFPMQQFAFQALKEHRFPQWDPSMYCGLSFAGNVQAALFYPPTWLMYAASWRRPRLPFKMLEYFAFAHIWLGFLLCYLWLHDRHLGSLASVLGGAVFAYGGYMVSESIHLGVISGMAWMPLGLWGIDQAVEQSAWRPLWKTALASAMCFLAGYPHTWVVFCVTTFVYALQSRARWRAAAGVLAAIAGSLLLAMVQILPSVDVVSRMVHSEKYGGEASLRALITFFVPNWFDFNPGTESFPDDSGYFYFGLATIFAVAWAIRRLSFRPYIQPLVTALFCLVLVANPYFLVYRAMAHFPLLGRITQAANFREGIAAMAALFTAIGVNDFLEGKLMKPVPRWLCPATIALLAAWSGRLLWIAGHGGMFAAGGRAAIETAVALLCFSLALYALRALSGSWRTVLTAALILAVGIDYKVYGTSRMFQARPGDVDKTDVAYGILGLNDAVYQEVWAHRDYRIVSDKAGSPNVTDFRRWGLATAQGFDPGLTIEYHDFVERWVPFENNREFHLDLENQPILQALGVRYAITHEGVGSEPLLAVSPNWRRVGQVDSFYRMYEYRHAQAPYGWEDGTGEVRVSGWMPERRTFQTHSDRGGRFFLVEQFYPGWIATVDGSSTPIERWNGVFQAIRAGPGEHTIVFEYRTPHLLLGAMVSLLSLAALIVVRRASRSAPRQGSYLPTCASNSLTATSNCESFPA